MMRTGTEAGQQGLSTQQQRPGGGSHAGHVSSPPCLHTSPPGVCSNGAHSCSSSAADTSKAVTSPADQSGAVQASNSYCMLVDIATNTIPPSGGLAGHASHCWSSGRRYLPDAACKALHLTWRGLLHLKLTVFAFVARQAKLLPQHPAIKSLNSPVACSALHNCCASQ